jgi:hypothetical protein
MKPKDYILALLLTLCFLFSFYAVRNTITVNLYLQKLDSLKTIIERQEATLHNTPIQVVMPDNLLSSVYDKVMEAKSREDFIRGFNEFINEEYNFKGHQERWEK